MIRLIDSDNDLSQLLLPPSGQKPAVRLKKDL